MFHTQRGFKPLEELSLMKRYLSPKISQFCYSITVMIQSSFLHPEIIFILQVTLCLLAKTSTGRVRHWRDEQCKIVGPLAGSASKIEKWHTFYHVYLFSSLLIALNALNSHLRY